MPVPAPIDFPARVVEPEPLAFITTLLATPLLFDVPGFLEDPGDTVPPTVTLVSPPANTEILPTAELVVEVTDNLGLRRVILVARFVSGAEEVVHQGDRFAAGYSGSRSGIPDGFEYRVTRRIGWTEPFSLDAYAFDTGGNEAL